MNGGVRYFQINYIELNLSSQYATTTFIKYKIPIYYTGYSKSLIRYCSFLPSKKKTIS